jgi:beta-ureidopropionase / N-carbamoyl-L-amino-acid hydrolase
VVNGIRDGSLVVRLSPQTGYSSAAAGEGIAAMDIRSAAGHDSRQLHYVYPTGMIFIPCRGGISHNPAEWAEPAHITAGAKVLASVIGQLAR